MGEVWARQVGSIMGLVALTCAILLIILIPNEIWSVILYLGLIALVGFVGWIALVLYLIEIA